MKKCVILKVRQDSRLELRARSELDLRIVAVGGVIVLNSIPQQAELLSQVR